MKTDPHEMAFPISRDKTYFLGCTKREYFAAMALQGIIARQPEYSSVSQYGEAWAADAVFLAEKLISALNKYS